ncbi:MAG: hypothetical protein ABEJ35_02005 [Halobacteriaceae archaeon]
MCESCALDRTVPVGVRQGSCACGLPWFETPEQGHCLDPDCRLARPADEGPTTDDG